MAAFKKRLEIGENLGPTGADARKHRAIRRKCKVTQSQFYDVAFRLDLKIDLRRFLTAVLNPKGVRQMVWRLSTENFAFPPSFVLVGILD